MVLLESTSDARALKMSCIKIWWSSTAVVDFFSGINCSIIIMGFKAASTWGKFSLTKKLWIFAKQVECRRNYRAMGFFNDFIFISPFKGTRSPLNNFNFWEPHGNFFSGGLIRIGSMDQIASNINAKVASDGSRSSLGRFGGSNHGPDHGDNVQASPNHGNDGTGPHVTDELGKEGLLAQVGVMVLQQVFGGRHELHGGQFKTTFFKLANDVSHEVSLNSVWFQEYQSFLIIFSVQVTFCRGCCFGWRFCTFLVDFAFWGRPLLGLSVQNANQTNGKVFIHSISFKNHQLSSFQCENCFKNILKKIDCIIGLRKKSKKCVLNEGYQNS